MTRDCGWRTTLGTCFYNRVEEARRTAERLGEGRTVLLIGPRNAGKSELARYVLNRLLRVEALEVDCRVAAARGLAEALRAAKGLDSRLLGELARRLAGVVEPRLGALLDAVAWLARRARRCLYVLVDEFQFVGDIRVLEAVAKMVAFYPEYRGIGLLVTSSEGVLMTVEAVSRLAGYNVWWVVVGEMPERDFTLLYHEYCEAAECRVGLEEFLELVGALPGYLPEVAGLDGEKLSEWMRLHEALLRGALVEYARREGVGVGGRPGGLQPAMRGRRG